MKTVVACGALALDVRRIASRRGWDVEVVPVPALLHNHPERIADAVAAVVSAGHDVAAVAYGDCGTYGALDGLPRLAGEHCYDVLAHAEVRSALDEEPGTYFLTDFLARTATRCAAGRAAERLGLPLVVREVGSDGLERQLELLLA